MNPGTTYHLLPQYSLEDTPFLKSNDSPENDCCAAKICTHPACLQRLRRLKLLVVLESLALVLLWGVALGLYTNRRVDSAVPKILYSPAQNAIEYEIRVFHEGFGSDKSIYQKEPSPEVDNAWDEMYNFGMSRITKEEASNLVNYTYRLPGDEEHYVIELDVFHEIHCLNMIRKALYPEYYKDMPGSHKERSHWNHCIESIRQSLLCSADISPVVWQWSDRLQEVRITGKTAHTCRNFEKIREWALERQLHYALDFTGFH